MRTLQRDVCGPVKRRLVQSPYSVAQMKADQMRRVNERMQHSSAVRRAYRNPKPKIYRQLRGPHDVTARNARPRDGAVSALKRRAKRRMLATFVNGARERWTTRAPVVSSPRSIMSISGVTPSASTIPTLQANSAQTAPSNSVTTQQPSTEKRAHGGHRGHHASAASSSNTTATTTASTSSSTASVTSQPDLSATESSTSTPTFTLNGEPLGSNINTTA